MTPSLFDLPLRIGDASALASVAMECAGAQPKPVTPEVRARVSGRLGTVRFDSMHPLTASLERDPTHPSSLYICADGVAGQPLLLRMAPAATPGSGLFPNAVLIGRTRIGPLEIVLNAIPFGPGDRDPVKTFAEQVNRAFLPRPAGSPPVIRVTAADEPGDAFAFAFAEFRKLLRSTGQNQAAFAPAPGQDLAEFRSAVVWAAIRTGWREGYSTESSPAPASVIRDLHLTRTEAGEWVWP